MNLSITCHVLRIGTPVMDLLLGLHLTARLTVKIRNWRSRIFILNDLG